MLLSGVRVLYPLPGFLKGVASRLESCQLRRFGDVPSCRTVIAAKHPFEVDLIAGKRYAWCACGLSKKQPFCDGSHKKGSHGISPLRFTLEESKTAWLCGCKQTKNPPYCDGSHKGEFVQKSENNTPS